MDRAVTLLDLERILKQDRLIRALTGLNRKAFKSLWPSFTEADERSLLNDLSERQRAVGGGRQAPLSTMEQKLFYLLLECKCDPTFDWLSVLFNFDRSCAHDWGHRLLPMRETALGDKPVLPVRQLSRWAAVIERFPAVKAVRVEGTERPVQRPKASQRQTEHRFWPQEPAHPPADDRQHRQKAGDPPDES